MDVLAVIPARGTSTRLPGKNRLILAGKPSIIWTIEHLQAVRCRPLIMVISDDREIRSLARQAGALCCEEPDWVARSDNLFDPISYVQRKLSPSWSAELIFLAYANAPVRPLGIFDRMIALRSHTGADVVEVLSEVSSHYHPYAAYRLARGQPVPVCLADTLVNSQDFPPVYVKTAVGSLFTAHAVDVLCQNRRRAVATLKTRAVIVGPHDWADIDTPEDAVWAEFLLRRQKLRSEHFCLKSPGTGHPWSARHRFIGHIASRQIAADTQLRFEDVVTHG